MPQAPQKYIVELPTGESYEIEPPVERSLMSKGGAIATGLAKGAIGDPLSLPTLLQGAKALPDIYHNIRSGAQPLGKTLTEFGKGAGTAAATLGALPYTLGRSIGDSLPVSLGGKPEVPGSSALSSIDPAAETTDPYEAYARRFGNVAALALAPELVKKIGGGATIGAEAKLAEQQAAARLGKAVPATGKTPALPGPGYDNLVGVGRSGRVAHGSIPPILSKTYPPLGAQRFAEAALTGLDKPQLPPSVELPPSRFSIGAQTPPEQPRVSLPGRGLAEAAPAPEAPGPPGPKAPPLGARLIKNPVARPNPLLDAVTPPPELPPNVELPQEPQAPRVRHATEAEAKRIVQAALKREAEARAAAKAKAAAPAAPAPPGPPPEAPPATTPPPSLIGALETTLADQRGEIDLTGEKGIPPLAEPTTPPPAVTPPAPKLGKTVKPRSLKSPVAAPEGMTDTAINRELDELDRAVESKSPVVKAAALARQATLDAEIRTRGVTDPKVKRIPAKPAGSPPPPGFTKTPTLSLNEMVEKYGLDDAAARAKMKPDELIARIHSGGDPAKLLSALRKELGADEAARRMGVTPDAVRKASGGSASTLPDSAVRRITDAVAREKASPGGLTPKTKALADRIASERGTKLYSGIDPRAILDAAKKHPVLFGTAAGGTLGALASQDSDDQNERVGKTVAGGLTGALAGAAYANPTGFIDKVLSASSNSMLSGGAIAKNLVTIGGGVARSAVEGLTPRTGRLGAAKEVFGPQNIAKNARAYWKGTANANPHTNPLSTTPKRTPGKLSRLFLPANIIGGIDQMGTEAFNRAGMSVQDNQRMLLTKHRNIIRGGLQRDFDAFPNRPGENPSEGLNSLARAIVRFQRVPTNVAAEGGEEALHMLKHPLSARSVYNAAQMAGSYKLGEWAKKSPRNRLLALIALAAAGPNTALSTISAGFGYGPQSLRMLGGLTPVPELEVPNNPKSALRMLGLPPAALTALQHLKNEQ